MRKKVIILLTIFILMVVGLPQQGKAIPLGSDLIEHNGLSWLSPVWSQNITYTDMVNRLSNNSSSYYGLRVATVYEVLDLFNSLPLVYPFYPQPFSIGLALDDSRVFGPAYGMMDPFFNQFGWYESGVSPSYSRVLGGYNWDPVGKRIMYTAVSESDIYGGIYSSDQYELFFSTFDLSLSPLIPPYYGTWLVKSSPVPEPTTMLLLGTGLVGIASIRFRKKN